MGEAFNCLWKRKYHWTIHSDHRQARAHCWADSEYRVSSAHLSPCSSPQHNIVNIAHIAHFPNPFKRWDDVNTHNKNKTNQTNNNLMHL